MDTWILITDASRARVFSADPAGTTWTLQREHQHPASRAKEAELDPSQRGRQQQRAGGPYRPAMEPSTPPKEVERETFARELAEGLERDFDAHRYAHLVLVAPPHFLGLLRKSLSDKVAKQVVATVDKDYTGLDVRRLPELLADCLAQAH
jgi:protein required for attachment to host cells